MTGAIAILDKDEYPMSTILFTRNKKRVAVNPDFRMLYDVFNPTFFTVNRSTTYTSAETSIVLDDASGVSIGDVLAVWPANTAKPAAEQVLVTNKVTNTLTVSRAFAFYTGTTQTTIPDESVLQIVGSVRGDKTTYADVVATDSKTIPQLEVTNYCELIFKVVPLSRVESNTSHYGTPEYRAWQRQKKLIEAKRQLEYAFLFGIPQKVAITTQLTGSIYTGQSFHTGGLYYWLSQSGVNYSYPSAPGVIQDQADLTEAEFVDFVYNSFDHGSSEKWLFATRRILRAIDSWQSPDIRITPGAETYGVKPRVWETAIGKVNLVHHPMLEVFQKGNTGGPLQLASAATTDMGMAFLVDMEDIELRYLQNMDLQMQLDVGIDGDEVRGDKISGMIGFQLHTPGNHGMIRNVSTFSA
jgi:hypothetical protein